MKTTIRLLASALMAMSAAVAAAQDHYPSRAIQLVLAAPPGGYYDRVARIVGNQLSVQLGQPVVIENKEGANGIIGTSYVARAKPDGYTILMGAIGPFGIEPALTPRLSYDPLKHFVPIGLVTTMPATLLVRGDSQYQKVSDLVAATKASRLPVQYASFGLGTSSHLTMERFRLATGAQLTNIPYRGSPPALLAVMSGEVEAVFSNVQDALPHIRSGKLRALAVASQARMGALPNTPTFIEAGVPQIDSSNWLGLLAPAGTPSTVIRRLNDELNRALENPQVRTQLAPSGELIILGGSPDAFRRHIENEIARWTEVVRKGNIKKE
ncbi:Twin-arginine translocation pathway signal [Hydrogenophaga intermedia]|uniref:Twin-arginine translocation pathway signal n=1 Tax=Hydrogenophaga intermedia TaxID=65786 RepID=A0A1L1Q0P9_HYDIT|nr:tripartite tricarboxylate transporter substrate binding protein [Hydrogenophaga intermedia]CDN90401.1 Twin-arginine translocation pathway signal [Hydrogenophaga intermedia]